MVEDDGEGDTDEEEGDEVEGDGCFGGGRDMKDAVGIGLHACTADNAEDEGKEDEELDGAEVFDIEDLFASGVDAVRTAKYC